VLTSSHGRTRSISLTSKPDPHPHRLGLGRSLTLTPQSSRDLSFQNLEDLPDIFTTYRKQYDPLRDKPRATVPRPKEGSLPPLPETSIIPSQPEPFAIPESQEQLLQALVSPVRQILPATPEMPEGASTVHPFTGGEDSAQKRLRHLLEAGIMANYDKTRNGLLGIDFSTKLSAFLAQGCITARQIHEALLGYEDGTDAACEQVEGFGMGENDGTKGVRYELLWRDFMRLCAQKYKAKLFRLEGFKATEKYEASEKADRWKTANEDDAPAEQDPSPQKVGELLERFKTGHTGMGLIDASQRELIHTGYTSNRARQNVATFLAKHLKIDWRYGAEWYELLLVDYDVCSNWANWQYVAGVGLDPRGKDRIFNPVKQAFDYDKEGAYVKTWVPEVRSLEKLENVFQPWTTPSTELEASGLTEDVMVKDPVIRIQFSVGRRPQNPRRTFRGRRGNGGRPNGQASRPSDGAQTDGQYQGQASYRGGYRGGFRGQNMNYRGGGGAYRGYYRGSRGNYRGGYNAEWNQPQSGFATTQQQGGI
jgi:deoxyribodipyrimidine photo-lyase